MRDVDLIRIYTTHFVELKIYIEVEKLIISTFAV